MPAHKIVISEFIDKGALALFPPSCEAVYEPSLVDNPEALCAALSDADALIVRNRTQVKRRSLDAGQKLKVIGRLGVGLDNIDMEACSARNIEVYPATGANTICVAEYVISAMSYMLRPVFSHTQAVLQGDWPRDALGQTQEMNGKSIGIIGFGAIGQAVGMRARALGMEVIAYDPHAAAIPTEFRHAMCETLEHLLSRSDVVTLHVPLNAQTRSLINQAALMKMKPTALLINTSRGGVVDEDALVETLRAGHLSGAVLDVFEDEPLNQASAEKFSSIENLVLTPHVSGLTIEGNARVSHMTVQNVVTALTAERGNTDSCARVSHIMSEQQGETT